MNIGESHELLTQFQQDLLAEADPDTRTWYEQEFKLQPEYAEALRAQDQVAILAKHLGQLAQVKAEQQAESAGDANEREEPIEPDAPEQPIILTPEQQLHKKIERKYETNYKQYQKDLDQITATKRSKREHQEKMAKRQFVRRFTDFSDVTGDTHVSLRADLLDYIATEVCDDSELIDEVFASCADYAEKHGAEVTTDPNNFAAILAGSVSRSSSAPQFEMILKSIFSTRHNSQDFLKININLANAAFELLENQPALAKIVQIATLDAPYMNSRYPYEIAKAGNLAFFLHGDMQSSMDTRQARIIFDMLNSDITGLNLSNNPTAVQAADSLRGSPHFMELVDATTLSPEQERFLELMNEDGSRNLADYDPITISHFSGTDLNIGLLEMPTELEGLLLQSTLFRKRMQYFAPFSYSVKAAKQIMESDERKDSGGVNGISIPLSPGIAVDIYLHLQQWPPSEAEMSQLSKSVHTFAPEFVSVGAIAKDLGVCSFDKTGKVHMVYRPLEGMSEQEGISIYRPCLPTDKKTHYPLQLLTINYARRRIGIRKPFEDLEDPMHDESEPLELENAELRQTIHAQQKRFLGRRPIKFVMPDEIKQTGLDAVHLRYDPKQNRVLSLFNLDDGDVEIELDRDFHIHGSESSLSDVYFPAMKPYYENMILKLVKEWACANEVQTSEGTISEESGNSANMGHYAYLRIRESDGRRYRHSEDQSKACKEEQSRDLDQESERLKPLDPTGRQRNSTYVRENYDPSKPPLEVYYSSLDND